MSKGKHEIEKELDALVTGHAELTLANVKRLNRKAKHIADKDERKATRQRQDEPEPEVECEEEI